MKYQINLYTLVVNICLIILINCCDTNNIVNVEIIRGQIITENYVYSPNGFIKSPFGKVNIDTKSFYKNKKLEYVLENKAEGYLKYSLTDLKRDVFLLKHLKIDTILKNQKFSFGKKETVNDTIFYKLNDKNVLIMVN